jgi:DNA-binding MarR family transcriptional regulator
MYELAAATKRVQAECICTRVRQVARAVTRIYDEAIRPTGLASPQFTLLVTVARFGHGGATLGKLAHMMAMDRTTLTRNLVPLEKAGLLRVSRSPSDARARLVVLTRQGERKIEAGFPLWEQAQEEVRRRLGATRASGLGAELDGVKDLLRDV